LYTKLVTKVVTIPIPFKDSYYDGVSPRKQIDGVKDLILAQIENDSTDIYNKSYPAEQYWRNRDRLAGDTSTDRTFSASEMNSSTLFDLSAVYVPKPNENVLKITFKFKQLFLDRLSTSDPGNESIIDSPIGSTSIFSIFDKYTTTPLVNIIAGDKGNFEDELEKIYPKLSKMVNIEALPTGQYMLDNFELTVEFLKGDGCVVTYSSDQQRTPIVKTLPKYSRDSLFSVFAIGGYITDNAYPANTEFYRYNIQPTQQALNVRESGDNPCYIQVEYGTLQNYIDENPLLTGNFDYVQNDQKTDLINGNLEIVKIDKELEFPLSITVVERKMYDGPVDPKYIRKTNQKTTDFQLVEELESKYKGHCYNCTGIKFDDIQIFVEVTSGHLYPLKYIIDDNGKITFEDNKYAANLPLYAGSKRQFLYKRFNIEKDTNYISLEEEFKSGWDPKRYMIFKNGHLLNNSIYKIIAPNFTNGVKYKRVYSASTFKESDYVDVFYIECDDNFTHVPYNHDVYMSSKVVYAEKNNQTVVRVPYPYKSYPRGNKYFFVFNKDGIYLDKRKQYTLSEDADFITLYETRALQRTENSMDYLVFVFPYVRSEFEVDGEYTEENKLENSGITFHYSYADGGTNTGLVEFKPVFNSYKLTKENFLLFGNTTYIDPSRYELVSNNKIQFTDPIDIRHAKYAQYVMVIFNNIGVLEEYKENSSENLRFDIKVQQVTATEEKQITFELPSDIGYNSKFLAFTGSLSLDESERYAYDAVTKTLILTQPEYYLEAGRNLTVITVNDKEARGGFTERVDFEKIEFPIVSKSVISIPSWYIDHMKLNPDNIALFINGTFISPNRYKLKENVIIPEDSKDRQFAAGKTATVLYFYKKKVSSSEDGIEGPYELFNMTRDHDDIWFDEMYAKPVLAGKAIDFTQNIIYGKLEYMEDLSNWYSRVVLSGNMNYVQEFSMSLDFISGNLQLYYKDPSTTDINGTIDDLEVDWYKVSPNANGKEVDNLYKLPAMAKYILIANNVASIHTKINANNSFYSIFTDNEDIVALKFEPTTSLETITPYTFRGMTKLAYVAFDKNNKRISSYAFAATPRLKSVKLVPNMKVEENAFKFLENLYIADNAIVADNAFEPSNNIRLTYDKKSENYIMDNTPEVRGTTNEVTVPLRVRNIQSYQFYGFNAINRLELENTVLKILPAAFKNCTSLSSLTLKPNLWFIGSGAFANSGLNELTIPSTVTTMEQGVCRGANKLTRVVIPNSIESILEYSFYGCDKLNDVVIEPAVEPTLGKKAKGLKYIADYAFGSNELTEITIPASVKTIGRNAFANCPNLRVINIAEYPKSHVSDLSSDSIDNAPWGAPNARVNYL